MSARPVRDAWLLPTLEHLLAPESLARLEELVQDSYWETAVRRQLVSDDDVLAALSARFRMRLADLSRVSQQARELVPEHLARKYRVLPLNIASTRFSRAVSDG